MAGKKSDLGPTGVALTHNVRRRREKLGLSYAELSRRLADIGRDIPTLGLRRIEAGTRRVDADDLMALAAALGVSPITLLVPLAGGAQASVTTTGAGKLRADRLWDWLRAHNPLEDSGQHLAEFWLAAWPEWKYDDMADELQARKDRLRRGYDRATKRTKIRGTDNGDD